MLRSTAAGTWSAENTGLTGDVSEVAIGFGRVWAVAGVKVATRLLGGGTWSTSAPLEVTYWRVVPVSADAALLFRDPNNNERAARIDSTFTTSPSAAPPTALSGRIERRGNELWAIGYEGGLVRARLVP